MLVITDLKPQRRGGYINVVVDGEFVCGLSDYQVALFGLHVGDEVTRERIDELQASSVAGKSYAAALRFLSYRIRSIGEVRQYLSRKEYPEDIIDALLQRLIREKYLDDSDFAQRWVRMRMDQNRSLAVIRAELMKKQIDASSIQRALDGIDSDDVKMQIQHLVQKKRSLYATPEKLVQYLIRKGFRYSDIRQVMAESE